MKPDEKLTVYSTKLLSNYENIIILNFGAYAHVLTEKDFKLIKKQAYIGAELNIREVTRIRDFLNKVLEGEK